MDKSPEQVNQDPEISLRPETTQETYQGLLEAYNRLTQRLRELESIGTHSETKYEFDKKRSQIHRRLDRQGILIGKTPDDVTIDILLTEGNLKEYGVEAPLIRLPLVGITFEYEDSGGKLEIRNQKIPEQTLYTPDDAFIARLSHPRRGPFCVDFETENALANDCIVAPNALIDFISKISSKLSFGGFPLFNPPVLAVPFLTESA